MDPWLSSRNYGLIKNTKTDVTLDDIPIGLSEEMVPKVAVPSRTVHFNQKSHIAQGGQTEMLYFRWLSGHCIFWNLEF